MQDNEDSYLDIDNLAPSTFFIWEDIVLSLFPHIITQKNKGTLFSCVNKPTFIFKPILGKAQIHDPWL